LFMNVSINVDAVLLLPCRCEERAQAIFGCQVFTLSQQQRWQQRWQQWGSCDGWPRVFEKSACLWPGRQELWCGQCAGTVVGGKPAGMGCCFVPHMHRVHIVYMGWEDGFAQHDLGLRHGWFVSTPF
jgi:hypothetical protein